MNLPKRVEISEVCPRDGWQNFKDFIPTETKIAYIKKMMDTGVKSMEITSFSHPKWVPQFADSAQVAAGVMDYAEEKGVELSCLVPNTKGMLRAAETGLKNVSFVLSASEAHNMRNSNKPVADSVEDFKRSVAEAGGVNIQLAVCCVFGSPFGDEVPVERVAWIIREAQTLGITRIGLADSGGNSDPHTTRRVLRSLKDGGIDTTDMVIHLHDTRGLGLANAYAAMLEGSWRFESSLGAMGGCPFIPGAKGNIGTEDLVYLCREMGIETDMDLSLTTALSLEMSEAIGHPITSSMANVAKSQGKCDAL